GTQAVIWALAFLIGLAFALWLWGKLITVGHRSGIIVGVVAGPVIIVAAALFCIPRMQPVMPGNGNVLDWVPFNEGALSQDLADGKTVLVDFTADWCPNCKTNEAVALNRGDTRKLADDLGVVTMKADWTNQDMAITSMLTRL